MKFGPVPLDAALGAVLAHSVSLPKGRLRKGILLQDQDVAQLRGAGLDHVVVARLEAGDVHEDAAAQRLAEALVPDPGAVGLRLGRASTGRVNLHAEVLGVVEVDVEKINAINAIHPMITVATVPPWQRMGLRGMVATVKIIAYGVPEEALVRACAMGRDGLRMRPVQMEKADLIQTVVGDDDGEKGHRVMAARLERLGVALGSKTLVAHTVDALAEAIGAARGEAIFILTGSATSDPQDVAPQALRAASGIVHHFGMPVDPGNLLFYGDLRGVPVIGLPGCARAPALNGADWVMERLLCGVPVSPRDIAGMGVGGLLKEIPSRPRPREG